MMTRTHFPRTVIASRKIALKRGWTVLLALFLAAAQAWAANATRTQTLELQPGWNAVFLEVHPEDTEPGAVFAGTPIDLAASFYTPNSPAQFITDPAADLLRQAGWGVWYAPDRPDHFLSSLHAIHGQRAYLVHATTAFSWTVTGAVVPPEIQWQANGFNFVGFSVKAQGGPTFARFFLGSPAHRHNRIYRLENGAWRRVSDPAAEIMRPGEAFWIFCQGASKYAGPLRTETATRDGLFLGSGPDTLVLRNEAGQPVTTTLEHVPSAADPVPLSVLIQVVADSAVPVRTVAARKPAGSWTQLLPPLEAGQSIGVPFEARLGEMTTRVRRSLLKVSTDLGTEIWLPITGIRNDLKEN